MKADFPTGALRVLAAALFALSAAASALTVDLGETREGEPVPLAVSRAETNRIEFPETIINAFSSSGGMDVRITGRSALVRTEDPAELIVLTEKRRVTLLLSPEEVPSRTVIMRDGDAPSPGPDGKSAGGPEALPYEKAITELVLSLASRRVDMEKSPGEEREFSPSLFLSRRARAASPPFFASLYIVRNAGSETASLTESMFSVGPETVAVGMERDRLSPGESSRVFVVTREEPGR